AVWRSFEDSHNDRSADAGYLGDLHSCACYRRSANCMGSLVDYRRPGPGARSGGIMLQEARALATDKTALVRAAELARLLGLIEDHGPRLMYLHGIAGIGKTTLLGSFAAQARSSGATVVGLDCRSIEPTERGFLHSLSRAVGTKARSAASVTERL